jgi:hypothetical protein
MENEAADHWPKSAVQIIEIKNGRDQRVRASPVRGFRTRENILQRIGVGTTD